jgi:transcriptional regulator with XRE-family HTH domain
MERGSRGLSPEYLEKLADFYKVSIDYLLGREEKIYDDDTPPEMYVLLREMGELSNEQIKIIKSTMKQFREMNEKLYGDKDEGK